MPSRAMRVIMQSPWDGVYKSKLASHMRKPDLHGSRVSQNLVDLAQIDHLQRHCFCCLHHWLAADLPLRGLQYQDIALVCVWGTASFPLLLRHSLCCCELPASSRQVAAA